MLAVLWWAWVGYAWLTSVIDPEEDAVRIVMFVAMAGLLLVRPLRPGRVRRPRAHVRARLRGRPLLPDRPVPDRQPRRRRAAPLGLRACAISTGIGVALLIVASQLDGAAQGALWVLALALDMGGPYLFGSQGWKLVPGHFAERHGLIVIIALGESIVAIGVGVGGALSVGQGVAGGGRHRARGGALVARTSTSSPWSPRGGSSERRSAGQQNEMARDSYSYLHFLMVAGIILVALGLKKTLEHVDDPLKVVPAFALLGGMACYLLGHVAFRYRHIHTINVAAHGARRAPRRRAADRDRDLGAGDGGLRDRAHLGR